MNILDKMRQLVKGSVLNIHSWDFKIWEVFGGENKTKFKMQKLKWKVWFTISIPIKKLKLFCIKKK